MAVHANVSFLCEKLMKSLDGYETEQLRYVPKPGASSLADSISRTAPDSSPTAINELRLQAWTVKGNEGRLSAV